jgi:hypothetical protein
VVSKSKANQRQLNRQDAKLAKIIQRKIENQIKMLDLSPPSLSLSLFFLGELGVLAVQFFNCLLLTTIDSSKLVEPP